MRPSTTAKVRSNARRRRLSPDRAVPHGRHAGQGCFNRQYAVVDFDPAPQLDGFWADALKPFRAVPRGEFGFKIVLRVIEDDAPEAEKGR